MNAPSKQMIARIDTHTIQYIRGILRPANIDTQGVRYGEKFAKNHICGHVPGSSVSSPNALTSHHDLPSHIPDAENTPVTPSSRNESLGPTEAGADQVDPKVANGDPPTLFTLPSTITGEEDQSSGSEARLGSASASDMAAQHPPANDDRMRRYVQLPTSDIPHHVAFGEIQHIRELLDRPRGRYWLQESSDHLRCPHCPWTLDRARCRPFSNLGAPRKYGGADEAKAGRGKVSKVAKQKSWSRDATGSGLLLEKK